MTGYDFSGNDLYSSSETSSQSCQALCAAMVACRAFVFDPSASVCYLKSVAGDLTQYPDNSVEAGAKTGQAP